MPSEMEMQQALEERMKALLAHASQTKVAAALGVKRTTVWRWAHGIAVTPGAVTRVQALLRPDLPDALLFADIQKEAAPSMTRRLLAGVIALEKRAGISPESLSAAQREAEAFEALALEMDREIAGDVATPERRPVEGRAGRVGGQSAASPGSKRSKR